ncbi:hypothetical protein QLT07_09070 [Streptococcus equi subsp. zooepidemicus]|uniref:hypothetical protein n=1 Tax=Streptococcus equi TaxID=1336 RepID=UPI0024A9CE9C|nr:hypothetical protein [Streptococcus equi]MDI6044703.1 hypothetical protein [Streptococcus equi subsp. zooepidemicus]HEL0024659.1 hypothetical protein [Streptococcus equi subsp. zooepidemicus]HEL1118131.1 hypothetical protein [Streptococcus equi subsp. zooepidemicus]HEL1171575.1 hypothetical protein [Streptococcus equi subsp. zooepidemicus]
MYQKYIFKVDDKSVVANQEIVINYLSINPDLLRIKSIDSGLLAELKDYNYNLPIEIIYLGKSEKYPTVTIKVTAKFVEQLEYFDKIFNRIVKQDKRFNQINCTFDGISEYYSSAIYAKLHRIERKGRELLKEMFYISDDTSDLSGYKNSIKNIDTDFTFGNLIDTIFKKENKQNDELIEYIEDCIEQGKIPEDKILPKTLWETLIFNLTKNQGIVSKNNEIESLLSEIRKARNSVTHCNKFFKRQYESTVEKINSLETKIDEVIEAIKNENISVNKISKELHEASSEILSSKSEITRKYIEAYRVFEKDLLGQIQGSTIDWTKLPEGYSLYHNFFENLPDKSESEIILETEKLENINLEEDISINNDDLTLIVPAQSEGFNQVFLNDCEWYDIRIGKARRSKIRYIAAYEVAPRSGIQYIAEVEKIVPSDNYLGYWKVIFKEKATKYDNLIPLGNTFPPQNIRYTAKSKLDEVASSGGTLETIFNNPY